MNINATLFREIFNIVDSGGSLVYGSLPDNTLSEKIYKYRMVHGYTQKEFAKLCSIGYSSLCKYELGARPSAENLKKIYDIFNNETKQKD